MERSTGVDNFSPDLPGCVVVVGTTQGRIVQLQGTAAHDHNLVPQRAMEERQRSVGPGTLHVLSNGFVLALRQHTSTVQAFDANDGASAGEWRLPREIQWLAICGGGHSLFFLGLQNKSKVVLFRFAVPDELIDGQALESESRDTSWRVRSLSELSSAGVTLGSGVVVTPPSGASQDQSGGRVSWADFWRAGVKDQVAQSRGDASLPQAQQHTYLRGGRRRRLRADPAG